MSRLRIYHEQQPEEPLSIHHQHDEIAEQLACVGIRFERWQANQPIKPGATQDEVLAAYRGDIDRLISEKGYRSVDVISLAPDHPERAALRAKFLSEHTHSEDEVRFFVAGSGQFTLHINDEIYDILCEQGDLIGVPDGTPHWFDMSESPYFVAIRLFTNPQGWVAQFTGNEIAQRFPRMQPAPVEPA
jgi:1,2-dihydroxy-3-keto-5-methylthiopentene dioxygenase